MKKEARRGGALSGCEATRADTSCQLWPHGAAGRWQALSAHSMPTLHTMRATKEQTVYRMNKFSSCRWRMHPQLKP